MKVDELLYKYQVRLGTTTKDYEYFDFYATTKIEKFLNKNNIKYARNMLHPLILSLFKNTILNKKEGEENVE